MEHTPVSSFRPFAAALAASLIVGSAIGATAATASTPPPTTPLSVFTYNVDLATSAVDSVENENAAGRTPTVEAVKRKHDADVVILDELFNQTSTGQIPRDLAGKYPYATPNVGQVRSGGGPPTGPPG
ncbi:hypothetical protein ACFYNO_17810 [Kitasatospora sp. NPDC006697]|uniref:hypothetical protein n=1 Tax=Kitasatospora sp. NPDC006697 TaxID=3364020 RepID=UPI00368E6802